MSEHAHTAPVPRSGSGRTPALHQMAATLRAPGHEVWLADPAGRHDDLAEHVDRHGTGVSGAIGLLQAADALIRQRREAGRVQDGPMPEPVVRLLVDDLPALVNQPQVAELMLQILRTGRAVGVLEVVLAEAGRDSFRGHPDLRAAFTRSRSH